MNPPFFSAFTLGILLVLTSCVQTTPFYTGQLRGGRIYVGLSTPRLDFAPWGLVKMPRPTWPGQPPQGPHDGAFWRGDGVPGRPRIHIVIGEQMAYFYKNDTLVGASPVCTGSPDFPTPRGNFRVIEKDADHLSSVYGDYVDASGRILQTQIDNRKDPKPPGGRFDGAKMDWFMRVTGGVGMHAGYLPGYADSHGCIRLPADMAETFYRHAPVGTPVKITE